MLQGDTPMYVCVSHLSGLGAAVVGPATNLGLFVPLQDIVKYNIFFFIY